MFISFAIPELDNEAQTKRQYFDMKYSQGINSINRILVGVHVHIR